MKDYNNKPVSQSKKIWIDLDNSPHVPFFSPIIKELSRRSYQVILTARDCFQVRGLADLFSMEYKRIGRHYGKNKALKVAGTVIRSVQLLPTALKEKPALAVSHGSRSQRSISDRNVEVYNLGREWYTSLHTLINYEVNLRHHHPDVIIVMHAYNDLIHNADFCYFSFNSFQEDYRHFYGPIYRLIKRPTFLDNAFLVAKSMWYHSPREVINTDNFPGLVPFERNLRTLIDLARTDGTQVVLMTQPHLIKNSMTPAEKSSLHMLNFKTIGPTKKWGYYTARFAFEEYNNVVRKLAKHEPGVYLIDLEPIIPKSLDYFIDDVHYKKSLLN